jgi:hypothetical protein
MGEQTMPMSRGDSDKKGYKAGREKGGEMTQTLYAHMNKRKKKKGYSFTFYYI